MRTTMIVWLVLMRVAAAAPIHPQYGDTPTRVAYHTQAGDAATDPELAAHHYLSACYWTATNANDTELVTEPCPRALAISAAHDYPAVRAGIDLVRAATYASRFDPRGFVMVQAIANRENEVDVTSLRVQPYARAWLILGIIYGGTGRFTTSLDAFAHARRLAIGANDPETIAWIDTWSCAVATWNGDLVRGRDDCDRARAWVDATGDLVIDMHLSYWEGEIADSFDEPEAALLHYERCHELARGPGGEGRRAWAEAIRIAPLVALGRIAEADRIAAGVVEGIASGRLRADTNQLVENMQGRLAYAKRDWATAARFAEAAAKSPEHIIRLGALARLAGSRYQLGDLAGARAALEEAVRDIEADRKSLASTDSRARYQDAHATTFAALAMLLVLAGEPAHALEVAEAGRARALLDAIHDAAALGVTAQPLTAAQVQATLAPDELLIEYLVTNEAVMALAVTRDSITPVRLAGDRAALEARVAFFRQLVEQADDDATLVPVAKSLYRDLLEPVVANRPSVRTLVISPDGPLHALPFDALYGDGFVVDRWQVVQVPSVSALAHTVKPASGILVVADPPDSAKLGRLPDARREARQIARRVTGELVKLEGNDATEPRVLAADVDRFAVLHFATHAVVDELAPRRSALILGPANDADGRWTIDEIYRRKLAADLVVLSACETAGGARVRGEGMMSIARAFLHAGATATIATRWSVDDAVGPVFASRLYDRLAAGNTLGAAATEAKRSLRLLGAAPRDWAAYVITGSPRGTVHVGFRVPDDHVPVRVALGVVLLVSGLAVVFSRRRAIAAGVVVSTMLAVAWLAPEPPTVHRGTRRGTTATVPTTLTETTIAWTPPARGIGTLRFFDSEGRLLGATTQPPAAIPDAARWWHLEIRDRGAVVASAGNSILR